MVHHHLGVDGRVVLSTDPARIHQGGIVDRNEGAIHHTDHPGDPSHCVEPLVDLADLVPCGGHLYVGLGRRIGVTAATLHDTDALLRSVPSPTTSRKLPTA